MKRTLIALCLTTLVSVCLAQNTKLIDSKIKAFTKSEETVKDPAKANNVDVLISHANLLVDVNGLYTNGIYQDMDMVFTVNLIGRPIGPTEDVTFGNNTYKKIPFSKFDIYTIDNKIVFWVYKQEYHPGALNEAYDCLKKAKDLNQGAFVGSGKGAIAADRLKDELQTVAMANFRQQKFEEASAAFLKSAEAAELQGVLDTIAYYYSGLCLVSADKYEDAVVVLNKVYDLGYSNGGDLECLLADALTKLDKPEDAIKVLESAIVKYPTNGDILFKSINAFLKANKDPKTIVETVHLAQKTDPNNVSLYLVEANLDKKLGDTTAYLACLNKVVEIDPNNVDPYFDFAEIEIEQSNAIYKEAEKLPLNDTKGYEAKMAERYVHLEKAADYYEKILAKYSDDKDVVGTLRQIYYQLRGKNDDAIEAKYNQYNDMYKKMTE